MASSFACSSPAYSRFPTLPRFPCRISTPTLIAPSPTSSARLLKWWHHLLPIRSHLPPGTGAASGVLDSHPHQPPLQETQKQQQMMPEEDKEQKSTTTKGVTPMAERWREYHGCDDWKGLLEPLDEQMRGEILKYGDLAQLTYDAFDTETRRCGVAEEDLLKGVRGGYRVTKYIYAKPEVDLMPGWLCRWRHKEGGRHGDGDGDEDSGGCWMGFVAVTEEEGEMERIGRREIVVAWRGTVTQQEWLEDMDGALVRGPVGGGGAAVSGGRSSGSGGGGAAAQVGVERGFWTLYASGGQESAREQVTSEVRRLVSEFAGGSRPLSITITGHSLGGALALLSAYDLAASTASSSAGAGASSAAFPPPISVISFAAPRVGNAAFKRRLRHDLRVPVLRIVNAHDVVPKVPGIVAHELDKLQRHHQRLASLCSGLVDSLLHVSHPHYTHVGTTLHLDNRLSPFLKPQANLVDTHNLEVYLHLLDAYRSSHEPFVGSPHLLSQLSAAIDRLLHLSSSLLSRDIALVNKTSALLLDELQVPPYWWLSRRTASSLASSTDDGGPPSI